jgi:hypothetical protein
MYGLGMTNNEGIISLGCVLPLLTFKISNDELRKGEQAQEDNLTNSEKKTGEVIFTGFPRWNVCLPS